MIELSQKIPFISHIEISLRTSFPRNCSGYTSPRSSFAKEASQVSPERYTGRGSQESETPRGKRSLGSIAPLTRGLAAAERRRMVSMKNRAPVDQGEVSHPKRRDK